MERSYTAWAILCSDLSACGLLVEHADNGTGDKKPLLFRSKFEAEQYVSKHFASGDYHVEVARVRVAVSVLAEAAQPRS